MEAHLALHAGPTLASTVVTGSGRKGPAYPSNSYLAAMLMLFSLVRLTVDWKSTDAGSGKKKTSVIKCTLQARNIA